jgi:hypothetical protein
MRNPAHHHTHLDLVLFRRIERERTRAQPRYGRADWRSLLCEKRREE